MRHYAVVIMALVASGASLAQDVAMGTRKGSAKRFEAPYTLAVETPHVKWAKPLPGADSSAGRAHRR